MIVLYYRVWCFKTKNSIHASMVTYWKAHKSVCFYAAMFCPLHSSMHKNRTTRKVPLQSIQSLQKIRKIPSWSMYLISLCVKAITSWFQQCQTHYSCEKCLSIICVSHWSHYTLTANLHLCTVVKNEWGHKGSSKVAPWYKLYSCCGWWKGTSQQEVTLIGEEIKSFAQAFLKIYMSEGISK